MSHNSMGSSYLWLVCHPWWPIVVFKRHHNVEWQTAFVWIISRLKYNVYDCANCIVVKSPLGLKVFFSDPNHCPSTDQCGVLWIVAIVSKYFD